MSGVIVVDFIGYWEIEGLGYVKCGDYEWMVLLVLGKCVLEIGSGVGFVMQVLVVCGLIVLVVDVLVECLVVMQGCVVGQDVILLQVDLMVLNDE